MKRIIHTSSFDFLNSDLLKGFLPVLFLLLSASGWGQTTVTVPLSGSGTWVVPCGVTEIKVEAWGGGGGGGRATSAGTNAGGGGGAYSSSTITVITGDTFNYSVGNGGSGNQNNKNGGDTSFNLDSNILVLAKGGKGAQNNNQTGYGQGGLASESIGTVRYNGGNGGSGSGNGWEHASGGGGGAARSNANGDIGGNGTAGNASGWPWDWYLGTGGAGGSSSAPGGSGGSGYGGIVGDGYPGNNYGGAGGGGKSWLGVLNLNGGNGAAGTIRITYTVPAGYEPSISAITNFNANPSTQIGCSTDQVTLTASGGSTSNGVSTLWYEGNECPSLAFIEEWRNRDSQGYTYINMNLPSNLQNGFRRFYNPNSNDPNINMLNCLSSVITPNNSKYFVFKYKVESGGIGGAAEIFIKKQGQNLSETWKLSKPLITDGNWHVATIDMSTNPGWTNSEGNITGWRFDFSNIQNTTMLIDYIVLSSVPIIEQVTTTADGDTTINLEPEEEFTTYGALRTAEQTVGCNNTVEYTSCFTTTIQKIDKEYQGSGDWNNPANWKPYGVPANYSCVTIPNGSSVNITDNEAFAGTLTVENGANIAIQDNSTLFVNNGITNQNSTGGNFVVQNGGNLIQVNNDAVNVGPIKVENLFTLSSAHNQYNYVISPVIGQKIKTIYPNAPRVIYHSENANYFYNAGDGDYIEGRSLAIKEPSTGTTVTGSYVGVPQNGVVEYTLSYTTDNPQSGSEHGWNLVGNPYPSDLDVKLLYEANSDKIKPEFYFWDNRGNPYIYQQGSGYIGQNYAIFNAASGTNGTGIAAPWASPNGGERVPTKDVKVGVGFMVQAKSTSNGSKLRFDNSVRTNAATVDFHGKNSSFTDEAPDDKYWLTFENPEGFKTMNAVVYFNGGKNEVAEDDTKASFASDNIYSIVDTTKLAIQGKSTFEISDTIKLGYEAFNPGVYKIHLYDKKGKFSIGQKIYLVDKLNNKIHKLTEERSYEFETEAGEFNDRFIIVYQRFDIDDAKQELKTDDYALSDILIYQNNSNLIVQSEKEKIYSIELFNLAGQLIFSSFDVKSKTYEILGYKLGKYVMVIRVITESGEIKTQNVILK